MWRIFHNVIYMPSYLRIEKTAFPTKLISLYSQFYVCLCVCFCFRFTLIQKHTVEFNQLAMANSEGSEAMLNRVMTKDNIGVAVLLELRKELIEKSCE